EPPRALSFDQRGIAAVGVNLTLEPAVVARLAHHDAGVPVATVDPERQSQRPVERWRAAGARPEGELGRRAQRERTARFEGQRLDHAAAPAASCPQAAAISRPRVSRTVTRTPRASSAARNAAIASRPEPAYCESVGLYGIRFTLNASRGESSRASASACS